MIYTKIQWSELTLTNSGSTLEPGGFLGSKANVIPLTWGDNSWNAFSQIPKYICLNLSQLQKVFDPVVLLLQNLDILSNALLTMQLWLCYAWRCFVISKLKCVLLAYLRKPSLKFGPHGNTILQGLIQEHKYRSSRVAINKHINLSRGHNIINFWLILI